jgi:hypothetical protein
MYKGHIIKYFDNCCEKEGIIIYSLILWGHYSHLYMTSRFKAPTVLHCVLGFDSCPRRNGMSIPSCFLLCGMRRYSESRSRRQARRLQWPCHSLGQRYSTLFVPVPPDVIYLQLCTPKVAGV